MAASAVAAPHPDFSGVFVVDLEASGSVDPLMEALGAPWLERKVAGSVGVTHTVEHKGDTIAIQIDSAVKSRKEVLKLDGTATASRGLDGSEITVHSRWSDDGQAVVTEADLPAREGSSGRKLVVVRSLEDGGKTMRQRIEVTLIDGSVLGVDRVFRRKGDGR
ncbi:MAG: hypothetical protein U0166_05140 [Acidobacteriota bacterium]